MRGVDVSFFQGKIDWQAAREDGVEFAMIKAGQGHSLSGTAYLFADRFFERNLVGAWEAGIACGVYYYMTAKKREEAEREADHFCSLILPYREKIRLWAAVDVEDVTPPRYCGSASRGDLTEAVLAFCRKVRLAGFRPMLYTNRDYLDNRLECGKLIGIPVWRAHWYASGNHDPENAPRDHAESMKIWQWGADEVCGIDGKVDGNIGFFRLPGKENDDHLIRRLRPSVPRAADRPFSVTFGRNREKM